MQCLFGKVLFIMPPFRVDDFGASCGILFMGGCM